MNAPSPIIKLALEKKLVTQEQLDQCREMLRKGKKIGFETTLEELLVKQGFLLDEQVEELRHITQLGDGTGTLFGHYRLGKLLGEGGMGKVYEATHEFMGRSVAIKVINQEYTSDKVQALRFFQEIRALIKLDHPNIVTIFDAGRVHRSYYYAMELLPGPSLKDYVDAHKGLPEKEALAIIRVMALALGNAHANSLVHRDVKPENIMFDAHKMPKLMDFGVAMHHDEHHMTLTQEGVTIGSLHYTSPEQVDGTRDIDCRADIYSLGATLYYALTGKTVYTGDSPQALLAQHLTGGFASPRAINKMISRRTAAIVKKMMAVSRDRRFQTMGQVVAAIDRPFFSVKLRLFGAIAVAAVCAVILGALLQRFMTLLP
jgi:eukaryotic-like serine/threonine-protein kinase